MNLTRKTKMRIATALACVVLAVCGAAEDRWVFMPCNVWGKGADNPHSLEHEGRRIQRRASFVPS